jgi:hypothetical protein
LYATCLFCHSDLGRNEVVEPFPVGRRLAYDAERGRLWVVCRRCERWNLTPLEERWEAIEEAERLYRGTRARIATEQVGLARFRDDKGAVELVRIGRPLRPEFAAWRYGDQFGRRRRKHLLLAGAGVAVGTGILVAGPVMGIVGMGAVSPLLNLFNVARTVYERRKAVPLNLPGERPLVITRVQMGKARLVSDRSGEWHLSLVASREDAPRSRWDGKSAETTLELTGESAVRAAGVLLPAFNAAGASARRVQEAVRLIDQARTPEVLFDRAARAGAARLRMSTFALEDAPGHFKRIPLEERLALEMVAHEETERRAMEGELALLEAAWRDAEEIAKIADELTLPASIGERLRRLKGDTTGDG